MALQGALTVRPVDIQRHTAAIAALLHQGFGTVAAEFGLTQENCPSNPAFLPEAALLEQLTRHGTRCFGIPDEHSGQGEWLGFAAIWPLRNQTWELTRLCVAPLLRHAGLGRMLLDAASEAAWTNGAQTLHIGIVDGNTRLKTWYQAYGFRETALKHYPRLPFTVCEMSLALDALYSKK
ncbi:MAG: GNAT family N-acetyltransferase [Oscillospiraceae bacterium]|jgi:GNAT superfamily N-acetyltransferase|nr:GNAT family N-acetyltransferase [Oscillospiraceae bacterium]